MKTSILFAVNEICGQMMVLWFDRITPAYMIVEVVVTNHTNEISHVLVKILYRLLEETVR